MTEPAVTLDERKKLDDYERGWIDGLYLYAWWKYGTLYVGTSGRTYAQAVDEFLRARGRR